SRTLDTRLGESSEVIRSQMGQSNEMVHRLTSDVLQHLGNVKEELVRVGEGNKQVLSISEQLKRLQDILKNPKQRGTLGEYQLEVALQNILPLGAYQMQYPFNDGTKVDAVIFYAEKIIPIDSKFSLENYTRFLEAQNDEEKARYEQALAADLKTRIDETSKYIKPNEDTLDFAFMFIPSEALYYDLLINKIGNTSSRNLVEYAVGERHVHIVSPTTIYAYLQTILQGLRQAEISRSAEQIKKNIGELSKHLERYETYMQKLGNHLQTSATAYTNAYKEFKKIDKDIFKITGDSMGVEPMAVLTSHTEEEDD
ncbi:MAG: DNA recombination protein RmuC, partial [Candidatus Liptonbacteria bacterium]